MRQILEEKKHVKSKEQAYGRQPSHNVRLGATRLDKSKWRNIGGNKKNLEEKKK